MNKLYTLLLILSVFVSCKMQNNAGYEIISSHFGENTRGFNISEIMDSVRYVKIDDSIPIGEIQDIQLGKDNIYLTDNSKILVLSYDGCIRHIVEHRGRAKNEYISMSSFSVHPTSGDISVYDDAANKVVVYDSTGNHLKTFSVDRFREFLSVEDGYYMYRNDIEHGSLSGLWHVDLNGGSLCRILTLDDSFVYHCFSKGYLSRVSDDITGLLGREDSNYIYHINNANKSVEEE